MRAYIITIGDEILIGQITDTNSTAISRMLSLCDVSVVGKSSVQDDALEILSGMQYGMEKADLLIMTGGLGPTKDDVTKKTLADFFGAKLVFYQEVYDQIARYFEKIGRTVPDSLREQAFLPDKAVILTNKAGSAQGMLFEREGKWVISLPGVPLEMEYIMEHEVLPRVRARGSGRIVAHRTLCTAGEGESAIAKKLGDFEAQLPPHVKLAYLPSFGQVRLRLGTVRERTGRAGEQEETERELALLEQQMENLLPGLVFGRESDTLEQVVGRLLLQYGKTLGTAESCTGGYVAHLLTTVPGSSAYYPGSVVTYSYEMKSKLLHVGSDTLLNQGAVSEQTVIEMAQGAREVLGVDLALSISGIAGPDGGTPDKPVGTVWMAVSDGDRTVTRRYVFGRDRLRNIQMTGVYALNLVRKFLLGEA